MYRGIPPGGPQPAPANRLAELLDEVRREFEQQAAMKSETDHHSTSCSKGYTFPAQRRRRCDL